jgi:hypothetical protein
VLDYAVSRLCPEWMIEQYLIMHKKDNVYLSQITTHKHTAEHNQHILQFTNLCHQLCDLQNCDIMMLHHLHLSAMLFHTGKEKDEVSGLQTSINISLNCR